MDVHALEEEPDWENTEQGDWLMIQFDAVDAVDAVDAHRWSEAAVDRKPTKHTVEPVVEVPVPPRPLTPVPLAPVCVPGASANRRNQALRLSLLHLEATASLPELRANWLSAVNTGLFEGTVELLGRVGPPLYRATAVAWLKWNARHPEGADPLPSPAASLDNAKARRNALWLVTVAQFRAAVLAGDVTRRPDQTYELGNSWAGILAHHVVFRRAWPEHLRQLFSRHRVPLDITEKLVAYSEPADCTCAAEGWLRDEVAASPLAPPPTRDELAKIDQVLQAPCCRCIARACPCRGCKRFLMLDLLPAQSDAWHEPNRSRTNRVTCPRWYTCPHHTGVLRHSCFEKK